MVKYKWSNTSFIMNKKWLYKPTAVGDKILGCVLNGGDLNHFYHKIDYMSDYQLLACVNEMGAIGFSRLNGRIRSRINIDMFASLIANDLQYITYCNEWSFTVNDWAVLLNLYPELEEIHHAYMTNEQITDIMIDSALVMHELAQP